MKKQTNKTTSKSSSRKVKFKFDAKDSSIMKVKWNSPNDKKGNELNINLKPNFDSVKIEDNH